MAYRIRESLELIRSLITKMDFYEFNLLRLPERAKAIWEEGKLLGIRYTPEFCIWLYYIQDFYTEAWYNENLNKVTKIRTFKSQNGLEPYVAEININDIKL